MDHYSNHLNQAIEIAKELEAKYETIYIGTEHLLYGMLCVNACAASQLLVGEGVSAKEYEDKFKLTIYREYKFKGYTTRVKAVFQNAADYALKYGSYQTLIGTEHVLLATLDDEYSLAVKILKAMGVNIEALRSKVNNLVKEDEEEQYRQREKPPVDPDLNSPTAYRAARSIYNASKRAQQDESSANETLLQYGADLTQKAREGKLDPVIGRRNEIDKVIQILSRRAKNNPVLVGEPGVGKSAVVEGLAQAIVAGEVPDLLRNKTVFSLNLTGLLAGTRYRGDFEERLKNVMDIITGNKDIILFIDEIHMIVGAGTSSEGTMDASNILKPMLARGELQTVGATTLEEYRKFIEKDSALERRFTPVAVDQPTVEDTIIILQGLKDKYEAHHNVVITDEAIEAAAKLSDRYITDRFLPDKAIDLIDEAASRERLRSFNGPSGLNELEQRLERANLERNKAAKRKDYARAAELSEEIDSLTEKVMTMTEEWNSKRTSTHLSIGMEEIAAIVSSWTGVPVVRLTEEESEKLLHLEDELHERIVGQDEAVTAVSKAIRRARAGLKDPSRPIGSFIFVGPTGVGKTDLCKALAESLFGDERLMVRLDMSEYMEKYSVSKLIGAPPGYVGYDDNQGGQLTERIRRKPYSVVLFDEIEKAHSDVFNILLQILDDGRLTDSKGRVVSFKNTVIIMTSNIGAHEVKEVGVLGFRTDDEETEYENMKDRIENALKAQFRPEFLNRLDDVIIFHKLTKEDALKICEKMLLSLQKRLKEKGIYFKVSSRARLKLVEEGFNEEFGARPLKRVIRRLVEDRLSEEILQGNISAGGTVIVDEEDGELTFSEE